MLPRYGCSLARCYCTGAGFFDLPHGVVVAPSFGRRREVTRSIYFFVNCDGEEMSIQEWAATKSFQSKPPPERPTLLRCEYYRFLNTGVAQRKEPVLQKKRVWRKKPVSWKEPVSRRRERLFRW